MNISNIDSLFFSIDIKDFEKENKELLELLESKKLEAKLDTLEETFFDYKTYKFKILPNGLRFHSYILHNEIISISISAHRSKNQNNYPVAVRLKSLFLWQNGFNKAYEESIIMLHDIFNGEFILEKVSRADLCCHTDDLELTIYNVNDFRGTFKKNELFMTNRKLSGMTFGTFTEKNVMCRIYNKSLEIKSSGKTWFNQIWLSQNMNIDNVWNLEFQIGRTFFKDYNIESVLDLSKKIKTIWEKLTTDFLTFITHDDMNISRCSTREEWITLQNAYVNYINDELIKRDKQMRCTSEELLPLLTGILVSYGACKFNYTLDDVMHDFKYDLKKYLKERKGDITLSEMLLERSQYIYS